MGISGERLGLVPISCVGLNGSFLQSIVSQNLRRKLPRNFKHKCHLSGHSLILYIKKGVSVLIDEVHATKGDSCGKV